MKIALPVVKRSAVVLICFCFAGCVTPPKPPPAPVAPPPAALPLIKLAPEATPNLADDGDPAGLRAAAQNSLAYYRSRPPFETYFLAGDTYTAADFADSMASFIDLIDQAKSPDEWQAAVRKNFQVYQSAGVDPQQTVTFSSYYEPSIPARLKRTETYRYPLYGRPPDLVDVDLGQFNPAYEGARIAGRREGRKLVPYYTRAEIDSQKVLKRRAVPVAWAKSPADIFFLQIEGSGWLELGGGRPLRIRYDGDNGRKYRSAGLFLLSSGRVQGKNLSHGEFENYLNSHPKDRQNVLNYNERYIFFRVDRSSAGAYAYGNIEVPLTAHRSIATDPKIFPKGMLAWISTDHPVLDADGRAHGMAPLTRFMLNQDEGGAIQGPGRVDYFAGEGKQAELFATHFWQKGKLFFLVKRKLPS
jgi:membrane-bound lytic murein transglycosylase A